MLVAVSPVVEALVMTPEVAKILEVKVLRNLSDEEPSEKVTSADGVVLPAIWRRSVGAETPIPTLPFARTLKNVVPDDDATANGLSVVDPCTRNAVVAEVAFTPDTVPLSRNTPVVSPVEDDQRAT